MSANEWRSVHTAVDKISNSGLIIDTTSSITAEQLRSACLRAAAREGLGLIVIDHLHLMAQGRDDETVSVARNMSALRILAKDLNVPLICVAQLSRNVEGRQDKHPMLSDLRQAGKIEEDAYSVMLMYRDEYYNPDTTSKPGVAEVNVAKHRDGETGSIDMYFDAPVPMFRPLARNPEAWG
jgi:replicative DNA helicase